MTPLSAIAALAKGIAAAMGIVALLVVVGFVSLRLFPGATQVHLADREQGPHRQRAASDSDLIAGGLTRSVESPRASGGDTRIAGSVHFPDRATPRGGVHVAAVAEYAKDYAQCVLTDSEGRYELVGLESGTHHLWAWRDSWALDYLLHDTQDIFLERGEQIEGVDIKLARGTAVSGCVIDAVTKRPLPGARVDYAGRHFTKTDATGTFRLEGVVAGSPALSAWAEGYATCARQIAAPPGSSPEVVVPLLPGGSISGCVATADNAVAAGAIVRITYEHTSSYTFYHDVGGKADASGEYTIRGIPFTAENICAEASLNGRAWTSVGVPGFSRGVTTIRQDIQLRNETTVAVPGRVNDMEGRPLAGVELHIESTPKRVLARTDEQGAFRIGDIPGVEGADCPHRTSLLQVLTSPIQRLSSPAPRDSPWHLSHPLRHRLLGCVRPGILGSRAHRRTDAHVH